MYIFICIFIKILKVSKFVLLNLPRFLEYFFVQGGREVTVHPDNTHLRLNLSLHSTAQHAVQCKMAVWQQCPR